MLLCDFHLHTTKSDGVFTPERLFDDVRKRDLAAFSVTDHDCMDAYPVPDDLRERCIPGMEIDCEFEGRTIHLLAYGIEDRQCELLRTLALQRERRLGRMQDMLDRLRVVGINVSMDEVRGEAKNASSIGRPHLARVLVTKKHVATVQEAFDRYLCEDQAGFVALSRLQVSEIIALAREAGAVVVAAHPMRLQNFADVEKLAAAGLDGIEVIHPTASPDDEAMLAEFARARSLLVTGGTDFHAPAGTPLGVELTEEAVGELRGAIARRRQSVAVGAE